MSEKLIPRAKRWARAIKRDVHALWLAGRDARTPRLAKALALVVAAYALSPIDFIPDFIPIVGYLDDLIILPLGIKLVIRLIPPTLMTELRLAALAITERPVSRLAAVCVIAVWAVCLVLLAAIWLEHRE